VFLLLTATSWALDSAHISAVGEEITPGFAGSWVRLFPDESNVGAWHFLFGAGGDYNLLEMSAEFDVQDANRVRLTDFNTLDDHAISKCPDGSYFHVGSAGVGTHNDSGYAWRYDAAFETLGHSTISESHGTLRFNDMAMVCSEQGTVAAFYDISTFSGWFFTFDEDAQETSRQEVLGTPFSTEGTTLLEDPHTGKLLHVGTDEFQGSIEVATLEWDLTVLDNRAVLTLDDAPDSRVYWAQSVQAVGDRFLVAYMHQTWSEGWKSDWGDLWIAVFDRDWTLLETNQITDDPVPDGSMRPSMLVEGDKLLLTYDRITGTPGYVSPRIRELTLDLAAFDDPDDTGDTSVPDDTGPHVTTDDTGTITAPADSGDTDLPPPAAEEGCLGCTATRTPPVAWVWLLPGLVFARRRQ